MIKLTRTDVDAPDSSVWINPKAIAYVTPWAIKDDHSMSTCIHLTDGGYISVAESVDEVVHIINKAGVV